MAKQTGLGDAFYIGGRDISGDVGSLNRISGGNTPLEVTAIDKSAVERLGGKKTGVIEFNTWLNDATDQEHDALSGLPTTDVIVTYLRGTTLGNSACAMTAKQVNYDATRGADGSLSFAVQALSASGVLDWGKQLTAGTRTDSGAANGTAVDFGADADLGMQMYLQALDFTGTDVTVSVEDSANGSTGWATVASFTQITGSTPLAEYVATSRTENVKRYLRAVTATSGGFSDFDFVVVANQNVTETLL